MDNEKLYDFLVSAGRPMTIGEIHKQPQFRNEDRRTISVALCSLAAENLVFRKLVDGKAYYSTDSNEGVSRNPAQLFISGVASNMNRALRDAQNPELANLGNLLNSLRELFGELVEDDAEDFEGSVDPHVFTYQEGRVADCGYYTIAIPDGFELEMGKDGRDFVAWLPDEDSKGCDDARITLFAGNLLGDALADMDERVKSAEMAAALAQATQWKVRTQSERFLGFSEFVEVPVSGEVGGSYLYNSSNYQLMLGLPVGLKQMRVLDNDLLTDRDTYHQSVLDWVATLRLKEPFAKEEELDSDAFLPLTEASLDNWVETLNRRIARIKAINSMRSNICMGEFEYDAAYGTPSVTMLKRKLRDVIKGLLPYAEAMCESAASFLERVCAVEAENPLIKKLYEQVREGLDSLTITITMDQEDLRESSPRKDELCGRVESCFAAWKTESERLERVRRARERAEAERRREEEVRRREQKEAACAREIQRVTQSYEAQEAEAERAYRSACAQHERSVADLYREVQRMKEQLSTFSSMDMGRKGAMRAKIANTERDIKQHEQVLAELREDYERGRAERKAALDGEIARIKNC